MTGNHIMQGWASGQLTKQLISKLKSSKSGIQITFCSFYCINFKHRLGWKKGLVAHP